MLENTSTLGCYLVELSMIKEHETMCRESQRDSLKIKRAIVTVPRSMSI